MSSSLNGSSSFIKVSSIFPSKRGFCLAKISAVIPSFFSCSLTTSSPSNKSLILSCYFSLSVSVLSISSGVLSVGSETGLNLFAFSLAFSGSIFKSSSITMESSSIISFTSQIFHLIFSLSPHHLPPFLFIYLFLIDKTSKGNVNTGQDIS